MNRFLYILLVPPLLLLTSCGGSSNEIKENGDYEGTKKMVADILKTDEGKKAITEVLASDDMQQTYVIDSKIIKEAVTETLSSDKGKEYWTKMFQDPKFVESFALALQDQQEEVIKNLMSDSEYQKKLMEVLNNPEMEKQTLTLLTSQQFRAHLEKVMEETFDSPMFKAKLSDLILNAAKEMKPKSEGENGSSGGSEGGGGGQEQQQQEESDSKKDEKQSN
ncbi:spore germination protein GerD [Gracilibacillus boraciitolerans JCM 21714]|uniref:Spore germination protein GerD n=1 Tax=Gracilibacillus boraciitolerans JCM 21714 TaxID=1298598 RepID=W4VLN6_9BACI|nr:spore germination lipoprotein GerD [Gracilibacillus boraciitolerans]GAE93684.1 spore germination protein GerD [Gracilibacillus boraciitolerans JCM 21714]